MCYRTSSVVIGVATQMYYLYITTGYLYIPITYIYIYELYWLFHVGTWLLLLIAIPTDAFCNVTSRRDLHLIFRWKNQPYWYFYSIHYHVVMQVTILYYYYYVYRVQKTNVNIVRLYLGTCIDDILNIMIYNQRRSSLATN